MTERENMANSLYRIAGIARGLSRASRILGIQRDIFVQEMETAADMIKTQAVSTVPFQSECPECGKKITVAFVNGQRRVKWDA